VADLPAKAVADGSPLANWTVGELPPPRPYPEKDAPAELGAALLALLADPNLSDHEPVTSHYDQTVGNRTVRAPGDADAAVLRLPDSTRGFALALEGRGETCAADARLGVQAALAGCMRDLACVGAEMVAVTDGLNMGSPSDPVENARLKATIEGLGEGLRELGVPVTGGNASLFNESPKGAIPPTPMVGALGVVEDLGRVPRTRVEEGQVLLALGGLREDVVASRYGRWLTGEACAGTPAVDLGEERALAALLRQAIAKGWAKGTKAAGLGGLGVALAKLCLRSGVGARVELPRGGERPDWMLFGEYPAQAWVACDDDGADAVEHLAAELGVPCARAGRAGGGDVAIADHFDVALAELEEAWRS
jgi:phosphoribosylformylglycinamidine synthase